MRLMTRFLMVLVLGAVPALAYAAGSEAADAATITDTLTRIGLEVEEDVDDDSEDEGTEKHDPCGQQQC